MAAVDLKLIVIIVSGMIVCCVNSQDNEFVLHPEKLDSLVYRAAISALLKSKFKVLAKQVDDVDRIIYTECQREAQTIIQQAKCLVKLMDAREQKENRERKNKGIFSALSVHNEDNPLRVLLKAIMETNWSQIGNLLKKNELPLPSGQAPNFKVRRKRSVEQHTVDEKSKEFTSLPKSIQNLRRIERYLRLADYCKEYVNKLNEENARQLQRLNYPTEFRSRPPTKFSAFETFQEFLHDAPFERISILSPRIMSLFPSKQSPASDWSRFFSPTLFSFHKEGVAPLPNMFSMVLSDQREIHAWLDLLLQWSGAAKKLDQMINTLKPEMAEVEQKLYPNIKHLEELDNKWSEFESKQSIKQRTEMKRNGYTFLDSKQAEFLFDNVPEHVHYTSKQKEFLLEQKIRELAKVDEQLVREKTLHLPKTRAKRQYSMFQNQFFPTPTPNLYPQQNSMPNLYPQPIFPQNPDFVPTLFPSMNQHPSPAATQSTPTQLPAPNIPILSHFTTTYIPPISNQFTTAYTPWYEFTTTPFRPNFNQFTTQSSLFPSQNLPTPQATTIQSPANSITQAPVSSFTAPSVAQSLTTLVAPTTTTPASIFQIPGMTPPPTFNEFKKMLNLGEDIFESPDAEHGQPKVVVLEPWAASHRLGGFIILEGVVLSPHAMTAELFSPELMTFHVLSPRAFIAATLSPMALFSRILSPTAFRGETLSPDFLGAYVLTPEAFLGEILSPKILEVRVLSPKAFTLQVLSPIIGSPRVQSPESIGLVVLSPSILSPHIMSDGCLNVEILSPHLLSGHDEHEHKHDEHHSGHSKHHHCCNRNQNRCCNQKLPKHESNSHFNQFVHSRGNANPPSARNLSKNDQQTNRNLPPKQVAVNSRPSLGKLPPALPPPYAFWPRKPSAMGTTKLMTKQVPKLIPKMPISRVLMSRQYPLAGG